MNKADFKKMADKLENSTIHPIKIDKLTNENWQDWSFCMSSKLRIARLWTMVNTEFEDDVRQMSEYTTLNQMTIDQIILNVDITIRQDLYRKICIALCVLARCGTNYAIDSKETMIKSACERSESW